MKKFNNYLFENKLYEYVLEIMPLIREQITDIKTQKYYLDFDETFGIKFYIKVNISKLKTLPIYNSNISVKEIIDTKFNGFEIPVIIEDNSVDENKFFALIAHELSHVYQVLSGNDIFIESFEKMGNIEEFRKSIENYKYNFLNYIYLNFEHELDAKVNQIYEGLLYNKNFKSFEDMWNWFINDEDNSIIYLGKFSYDKYLKQYNQNILLELTNQFNILYGIEKITITEIKKYYDDWKIVFQKNVDKYLPEFKDAVYQAFNKIKRYEESKYYDCTMNFSLLEKKLEYDPTEEILKMVEKFKKINSY